MNRDERPTRARGIPPDRFLVQNVPVLMPLDPDGGGTWVSVSAVGLSLALLNRYGESPVSADGTFTSRGRLIREMAGAANPIEVGRALELRPLEQFRPFTLAALAGGGLPQLFDWDGARLLRSEVRTPGLVRASSGSNQVEAERVRGGLFRAAAAQPGGLTGPLLERLHRSHEPERGQLSICMHRQEAMTVSLSLITVSTKQISIFYVDGPPGETPGGSVHTLPASFHQTLGADVHE